jgi:hypothetical protein
METTSINIIDDIIKRTNGVLDAMKDRGIMNSTELDLFNGNNINIDINDREHVQALFTFSGSYYSHFKHFYTYKYINFCIDKYKNMEKSDSLACLILELICCFKNFYDDIERCLSSFDLFCKITDIVNKNYIFENCYKCLIKRKLNNIEINLILDKNNQLQQIDEQIDDEIDQYIKKTLNDFNSGILGKNVFLENIEETFFDVDYIFNINEFPNSGYNRIYSSPLKLATKIVKIAKLCKKFNNIDDINYINQKFSNYFVSYILQCMPNPNDFFINSIEDINLENELIYMSSYMSSYAMLKAIFMLKDIKGMMKIRSKVYYDYINNIKYFPETIFWILNPQSMICINIIVKALKLLKNKYNITMEDNEFIEKVIKDHYSTYLDNEYNFEIEDIINNNSKYDSLDNITYRIFFPSEYYQSPPFKFKKINELPSLSELVKAGIKIKPNKKSKEISFDCVSFILTIPKMSFDDNSFSGWHVIYQLEVFEKEKNKYMTSLFSLLFNLYKTDKDFEKAKELGLISRCDYPYDHVKQLLNKYTHFYGSHIPFSFYITFDKLLEFYKKRKEKWYVKIKILYFDNKHATLASFVAIILFIITLLAVIFTGIQTFK